MLGALAIDQMCGYRRRKEEGTTGRSVRMNAIIAEHKLRYLGKLTTCEFVRMLLLRPCTYCLRWWTKLVENFSAVPTVIRKHKWMSWDSEGSKSVGRLFFIWPERERQQSLQLLENENETEIDTELSSLQIRCDAYDKVQRKKDRVVGPNNTARYVLVGLERSILSSAANEVWMTVESKFLAFTRHQFFRYGGGDD